MIKICNYAFTRDSNHTFVGRTCFWVNGTLLHASDAGELTMRTGDGRFVAIDRTGLRVDCEPSDEALKAFAFADEYTSR